MNPRYQVEPLDKHKHNREAFSCGVVELDSYLRERAGQDIARKVAVVYVLCEVDSFCIAGYYTLSMNAINFTDLPPKVIKKLRLPRYPALPASLIGRLAVDVTYQGRGIGRRLLVDALQRCLRVSNEFGTMAVTVDAKGDDSRRFYEGFGFRRFPEREYSLYMPMVEIAQLFPPPSLPSK